MAKGNETPKSRSRLHVLDAYRGRGPRNNNLYLVYSVKTDRDWILTSDRQFIHWICFLEINQKVKTFDLSPELVILDKGLQTINTELDAIAELTDSTIEWHELRNRQTPLSDAPSRLLAEAAASSKIKIQYKAFTDIELKPVAQYGVRWFKALSFAATLREGSFTHEISVLSSYLKHEREGMVSKIANDLENEFDDLGILLGLLTRLAVKGFVTLDLTKFGLCMSTFWRWGDDVVNQ